MGDGKGERVGEPRGPKEGGKGGGRGGKGWARGGGRLAKGGGRRDGVGRSKEERGGGGGGDGLGKGGGRELGRGEGGWEGGRGEAIAEIGEGERERDRRRDVRGVLLGGFHWRDYLPWLAWISKLSGLDTRVRETHEKGDEFLESVIERTSSNFDGEGEDGCDHSFVDVLLSLEKELKGSISFDKRSIKAILMDMFGAGTDSTYISIEWVMAELVRNPNVMIKLKQEIKHIAGAKSKVTEENLAEMPYLKAIIKETFRLHPPAPILLPRESMQDTMIQGYNIPKHTRVLVNVWAIGRDPRIWSDAEKFMPERFMDSEVDFKGQDYELIPFGAGRRICPGIQLANVIIELAVANIMRCFDWRLPEGLREEEMDMAEAPGIASRKKINLNLVAIPC
ncbi:cytochrome P450 71A1-like [Asparagus officinalis]|uniref:cytochrome P450 71A1-like n=1 Tax=Asparagus officinalis TaxID=4686 RepID=UPI00098DE313|nr:cytochrome P450 71A1-like [Asparagus officinalis]